MEAVLHHPVVHRLGRTLCFTAATLSLVALMPQAPARTARACASVDVGNESGHSLFPRPAGTHQDSLDITEYHLRGSGGQATLTLGLGAAPKVPVGADGAAYYVAWRSHGTTFYAEMQQYITPQTAATTATGFSAGRLDPTTGAWLSDPVAVSGSVDGATITIVIPYGTDADAGMGIDSTAAYAYGYIGTPGTPQYNAGYNGAPADAAPEGSVPGAEAGPGGQPFC